MIFIFEYIPKHSSDIDSISPYCPILISNTSYVKKTKRRRRKVYTDNFFSHAYDRYSIVISVFLFSENLKTKVQCLSSGFYVGAWKLHGRLQKGHKTMWVRTVILYATLFWIWLFRFFTCLKTKFDLIYIWFTVFVKLALFLILLRINIRKEPILNCDQLIMWSYLKYLVLFCKHLYHFFHRDEKINTHMPYQIAYYPSRHK